MSSVSNIACLALADGKTADRVAVEADVGERLHAFGAQRGIGAALHDAEQAVARPLA